MIASGSVVFTPALSSLIVPMDSCGEIKKVGVVENKNQATTAPREMDTRDLAAIDADLYVKTFSATPPTAAKSVCKQHAHKIKNGGRVINR